MVLQNPDGFILLDPNGFQASCARSPFGLSPDEFQRELENRFGSQNPKLVYNGHTAQLEVYYDWPRRPRCCLTFPRKTPLRRIHALVAENTVAKHRAWSRRDAAKATKEHRKAEHEAELRQQEEDFEKALPHAEQIVSKKKWFTHTGGQHVTKYAYE